MAHKKRASSRVYNSLIILFLTASSYTGEALKGDAQRYEYSLVDDKQTHRRVRREFPDDSVFKFPGRPEEFPKSAEVESVEDDTETDKTLETTSQHTYYDMRVINPVAGADGAPPKEFLDRYVNMSEWLNVKGVVGSISHEHLNASYR